MISTFILLCTISWVLAPIYAQTASSNTPEDVKDLDVAENNILGSLSVLQAPRSPPAHNLDYLNTFPYEGVRENVYDTFVPPQPTLGVSVNTRALLAPKIEVLRLVEDFFTLISDIIVRINELFNNNFELIRIFFNLIVTKITNLQAFAVKGISVFRGVLEFILNIFANYSLTLPSITLGSSQSEFAQHATYGVPPALPNSSNFSTSSNFSISSNSFHDSQN